MRPGLHAPASLAATAPRPLRTHARIPARMHRPIHPHPRCQVLGRVGTTRQTSRSGHRRRTAALRLRCERPCPPTGLPPLLPTCTARQTWAAGRGRWRRPNATVGGALAVRPKKGDALLLYNLGPDGRVDDSSTYGACASGGGWEGDARHGRGEVGRWADGRVDGRGEGGTGGAWGVAGCAGTLVCESGRARSAHGQHG